jgi:hypothetical protein
MTSTKVICFMALEAHSESDKKLDPHKCQPTRSTPKSFPQTHGVPVVPGREMPNYTIKPELSAQGPEF